MNLCVYNVTIQNNLSCTQSTFAPFAPTSGKHFVQICGGLFDPHALTASFSSSVSLNLVYPDGDLSVHQKYENDATRSVL